MRNKINTFIDNSSLTKIFIVSYFFMVMLIFSLFSTLELLFNSNDINFTSIIISSLVLGMLGGALITSFVDMNKKSIEFWSKSKEIEQMIENTNTYQGLQDILENELTDLNEISLGGAHNNIITKLVTTLKTKQKYHG